MDNYGLKVVKSTDHASFDERVKTFSLFAGSSMYAFCITPELTLEHLYWGKRLPKKGYDLRYLSEGSRIAHFTTVEAVEAPKGAYSGPIVVHAETLEEIQKTWRENVNWKSSSKDEGAESLQKKRIENFSWRLLSKQLTHNADDLSDLLEENTLTSDFIPFGRDRQHTYAGRTGRDDDDDDEEGYGREMSSQSETRMRARGGRQRAVSNPVTMKALASYKINPNSSLQELSAMAKLKMTSESRQSSGIPSPVRTVDNIRSDSPVPRAGKTLQTFERQLGKLGKGALNVEYSDYGTGDFRTPSFIVVDNFNGSSITPLRYRSHKILKGKIPIEGMPSIRCLNANEASTIVVTLGDSISGLEVDLIYTAMHNYDCIMRRAVFRNNDTRKTTSTEGAAPAALNGMSKVIQKASSVTIDFECSFNPFYVVQLSGSWARERYIEETKLNHGIHSFGSTRGVSGHQHNPFAAISFGPPCEDHGEVRGFSLVYSGNFLVECEINEMGKLRMNMGIHPQGLQWYLKQGSSFCTPEAILVRSGEGLGGMSRSLHRLFLDRLLPKHWSDDDPPILLNSWEAKYFHVNHNNILEMARQAVKIGINLLVLDDGWFGKRNDDTTSLGDWIVDLEKFPNGMKGLVEEINSLGCKFGLWFEPEMVSEQSVLFQSHPDWYLHVPGRPRNIGRNQMVLDFSRKDVRDYLFNAISAILSSANIEYIKWDMNRPLTEVYSVAVGNEEVWQAEISHRYVLGVYDLQDRLIKAFPYILLENCASGGGRFDPGMLYYSPQIWCSDNTDALVRMKIQYGSSIAYPTRCIGSHVSTVPNHLTGNIARLRTRGFMAMCGTFGYELDINAATPNDLFKFQKQIEFYKSIQHIVRWGDIYRLWDPFKANLAAWMYVSRSKSEALVFAFSYNSDHWNNLVPRLHLQGLLPNAEYEVTEPIPNDITQANISAFMIINSEVPVYQLGVTSVVLPGDILMSAGLPVKFYTLDDSVVYLLKRVN